MIRWPSPQAHIPAILGQHYGNSCHPNKLFCPVNSTCSKIGITVKAKEKPSRGARITDEEGQEWLLVLSQIGDLPGAAGGRERRARGLERNTFLKHPDKPDKQGKNCEHKTADCENRRHHACAWS